MTLTVSRHSRTSWPQAHARVAAEPVLGTLLRRAEELPVQRPEEQATPVLLDIVEEWGVGSFPASDPPANW
jgi:hypothetical protein